MKLGFKSNGGQFIYDNDLVYSQQDTPILSAISPPANTNYQGGELVTITGSGFIDAADALAFLRGLLLNNNVKKI